MRLQRPDHIRSALPHQLVLEVLDAADLLREPLLRLNPVQVHDNLTVQLQKAVVRLRQRILHPRHRLLEVSIHRRAEKHPLTLVKQLFCLQNEKGDILPLAIQVLQPLPLHGKVPLIFVCTVDGPLEVDHVAVRGKGNAPQDPENLSHIALPTGFRPHREPQLDVLIQRIDVLLHRKHIDLLIHLQHLLKKVQERILQHQQALRLADDPVFQKIFQPAAVLGKEMLQRLLCPQRRRLPAHKQEPEDVLFPGDDPQQLFNVTECVHTLRRASQLPRPSPQM